jgi:hypothetical protein
LRRRLAATNRPERRNINDMKNVLLKTKEIEADPFLGIDDRKNAPQPARQRNRPRRQQREVTKRRVIGDDQRRDKGAQIADRDASLRLPWDRRIGLSRGETYLAHWRYPWYRTVRYS